MGCRALVGRMSLTRGGWSGNKTAFAAVCSGLERQSQERVMTETLMLAEFIGSFWYYVLLVGVLVALIVGLKIYRSRAS